MLQILKVHPGSDTTKTNIMPNEVPSLTGLRFLAALSVAFAHGSLLLLGLEDVPSLSWLGIPAGFGMSLFFVLSGFVIHYNYRTSVTEGGIPGIGKFVWARFSRLYPLFLFVVAVDVIFGRQLFDYVTGGNPRFLETLSALPYFLTFTHSWFYVPYEDSSLIYITANNASLSWSISTEWFFYLSYPLIALALLRVRGPRTAVALIIAWSILWATLASTLDERSPEVNAWALNHFGAIAGLQMGYQDSFVRWINYFSPYLRIGEFVLGCLVSQLYIHLEGRPVSERERRFGLCLLTLGVISVPVVSYLEYSNVSPLIHSLRSNYGLAPSAGLVIFTAARYPSSVARFLNLRPLVVLGEASYSIYMLHYLVFAVIVAASGPVIQPTFWPVAYAVVRFVCSLSLVLLIALGVHSFLEIPSRKFLRALLPTNATHRQKRLAFGILAGPAFCAVLVMGVSRLAAPAEEVIPTAGLKFISATYGENCGAKPGNATKSIKKLCSGKESCDYVVDVNVLGDPAGGCAKSFSTEYTCEPEARLRTKEIPGEAGLGSRLLLSCATEEISTPVKSEALPRSQLSNLPETASSGSISEKSRQSAPAIGVLSATYGPNCGAPPGNWTAPIAKTCNNRRSCSFAVDITNLRDPAPGCTKSFVTHYQCAPDGPVRIGELPGEALFGPPLELKCDD
jgi:peptidoglycan/LPS O-acetylase OafA/YrhL